MVAVEILVGVLGGICALATMAAAVRTVVVPRGEQSFLANATILGMRWMFNAIAGRLKNQRRAEAVKARFAPVTLMALPFVWASGVILGCSGVFWALGVRPYQDALVLSGSSLTTLGFRTTQDLSTLLVEIAEGIVGLGLVALLISFLPTIYSAFSRRERAVLKWHLRSSGTEVEASSAAVLIRRHQVGSLEDSGYMWYEWEDWFVELEESHTSFPILVYFRSPMPERSWITCAGSVLDAAALYCSALDVKNDPRAQLIIRSGAMSLCRICDYFDFKYDPDPSPEDEISISQQEFDEIVDLFREKGLPVVEDQQEAWKKFRAWRVCYDKPLLSLASWVGAPKAHWSSDRKIEVRRPRIFHRLR